LIQARHSEQAEDPVFEYRFFEVRFFEDRCFEDRCFEDRVFEDRTSNRMESMIGPGND